MIYRPSDGVWSVKQLGTGDYDDSKGAIHFKCGGAGYIPMVGDIFGDGT